MEVYGDYYLMEGGKISSRTEAILDRRDSFVSCFLAAKKPMKDGNATTLRGSLSANFSKSLAEWNNFSPTSLK